MRSISAAFVNLSRLANRNNSQNIYYYTPFNFLNHPAGVLKIEHFRVYKTPAMHFVNFTFIWLVANNYYDLVTLPITTTYNTSTSMLIYGDYCSKYTFLVDHHVQFATLLIYDTQMREPEIAKKCKVSGNVITCVPACTNITDTRKHVLALKNIGYHIGEVIGYRYTLFDLAISLVRSIT